MNFCPPLYLNERYMKTNEKQKILFIWLKESNKQQKNVEQEIMNNNQLIRAVN